MERDLNAPEQLKMLEDNIGRIKKKLIVLSGKGGVGKSTVAVNMAYGFALSGYKVGILDVDLHGPSIVKMLGIEGVGIGNNEGEMPTPVKVHDNLHALSIASLLPGPDEPVIWRGPAKMGVIKQFMQEIEWPELDLLVIDCPPGTGDEPLSAVQILKKIDGAVIVSTPQDVAFLDARKTISFSQKLNIPILGIIENMSYLTCPHCNEKVDVFKGSGAEKAAKDFDLDVIAKIPLDTNIMETGDAGRPYIYDYSKKEGAKEFQKAIEAVATKLEIDR